MDEPTEVTTARVIDRAGNWAVVHLDGRQFPGLMFQGDTFDSLVALIENAPGTLSEELQELRSELIAARHYYESVLGEHGIRRPYF
jgi:predicted RNase H-like HicB family nuclease